MLTRRPVTFNSLLMAIGLMFVAAAADVVGSPQLCQPIGCDVVGLESISPDAYKKIPRLTR